MAGIPVIVEKTAMLFFDTHNRALHPEDPEAQARIAGPAAWAGDDR